MLGRGAGAHDDGGINKTKYGPNIYRKFYYKSSVIPPSITRNQDCGVPTSSRDQKTKII
jgi:hypothetical protein